MDSHAEKTGTGHPSAGREEGGKGAGARAYSPLTKRQEELIKLLLAMGRAKSPDIERAFSVTRARVNQIIRPLLAAGLIVREGRTRATTYRLP